jgi:hypothetical protein
MQLVRSDLAFNGRAASKSQVFATDTTREEPNSELEKFEVILG